MRHHSIALAGALLLATTSTAAQPRTAPHAPPRAPARGHQPPPAEEGTLLRFTLPGELQLRYVGISDISLATTPGRTDQPANLGQNLYFEGWLRLRPRFEVGERFRVVAQLDAPRVVVPDSPAVDVPFAMEPRTDAFPYGPVDLRWAYVEWDSPVGVWRLGQQGFSWGLGMLSNNGDERPVFGDYRYGDIVERVIFATRPGGRASDLTVAVAGDMVYRDRLVSLVDGDLAFQGVLAAWYQDHRCRRDCEQKRVGALATYRDVSFRDGDFLRVFAGDVFARWQWPTPDRVGRVFAGVEVALIAGSTNAARTTIVERHDVLQLGALATLGIERPGRYRFQIEGGWASGDRNPIDDQQRRFTFNPSHRVGLILFPEVIAWQTARGAAIAGDPALVGRAAYGRRLLPTNGGVSGAAYLYPTAVVNLGRYVDLRAGAVIATATSDWADPLSAQIYGTARNYRGGDASKRDLGLELDLGVEGRIPLGGTTSLTGGLQGGVLFPGRAFNDASGASMPTVYAGQARLGFAF